MLTMHGVRRGGAGYYLADPAWELPEGVPPQWAGGAAAALGLDGPLAPGHFARLLEGRHPVTGQPMGSGRSTVAAYDLTFSAPKSVSVLFALSGHEVAVGAVAAQRQAVEGALWYLERHALTVARPGGIVLPTTGAIAGCFTHGVNRNGDPHLHSHVVMANLVHGSDGRWGACDRRGLDAHRRAAAAVYESHLRAALSQGLGVRWTARPGRSPEIVGVPAALLGEFSSRGADIRRAGGSRRTARVRTRPAKERSVPYGELAATWRRRAEGAGAALEAPCRGADRRRPVLDEHRVSGVISLTPHGGARRRDVVEAMASGATDGVGAEALERLVDTWAAPAAPGVAEPLRARREVLPAAHHVRALGARPADPADHAVWVEAARTLDAYRNRWGEARAAEPLGAGAASSLPAPQLADRLRTQRLLDAARARLGRRPPQSLDLELDLGR